MPVIVPATSTSTSDTSSADRSASDANKRDDENTPSEVLLAAPTQEVRVAATAEDDYYYHDLSTLSETIDECDSEFCAGTCTSNVLQQIGQTFSHFSFFFGCNSLKKSSSTATGSETYTRTTTTEGSIECASPCCSPTNPNSPTGMSMIARPSISSYQRGGMNKMKIANNEENWDHAFRKGSLASSTKKPHSRKDKKKIINSTYYSTPKKRAGKAFATGSDRSALTCTAASKKNSSDSMSEPTYRPTLQGSTIKVPTLTLGPSKSSTSRKDPPTPFQSPMSSLSRSSAASSSHQITRMVIRQASVHQATPLHPLATPTPVSCRQGLGVVTGKKTVVLLPGYLHNFELADDHTSFKAGPVVSWAPATHSHGAVSVGDHIVKINGKDTRRMTALDATRMLHTKRHRERVVCLSFWFHE